MSNLKSRAEAYLSGPRIISEPGASLTRLIDRYVAGEPWDTSELRKELSLGIQAAQSELTGLESAAREGEPRDAQIFYHRVKAILQDIQAEVMAGQD